jgi:hypothetical protein
MEEQKTTSSIKVNWKSKCIEPCLEDQVRCYGVSNLLSGLKDLKARHLNVWCDNKSAMIIITNNLVQHDRTKHTKIGRFFIKQELDAGIIKINYVCTRQGVWSTSDVNVYGS